MTTNKFTGDEIISDVLLDFPEAQDILAMHGIACASCHINQYETLREGIIAHYGAVAFEQVLGDLNDAAGEVLLDKPEPFLTPKARDQALAFQSESGQAGYGFRIEVIREEGEVSYFLDFEQKSQDGDKVVESEGIKLFLDPESYKYMRGKKIDFGEKEGEAGFKIEKV